jgi:hypothetical protein
MDAGKARRDAPTHATARFRGHRDGAGRPFGNKSSLGRRRPRLRAPAILAICRQLVWLTSQPSRPLPEAFSANGPQYGRPLNALHSFRGGQNGARAYIGCIAHHVSQCRTDWSCGRFACPERSVCRSGRYGLVQPRWSGLLDQSALVTRARSNFTSSIRTRLSVCRMLLQPALAHPLGLMICPQSGGAHATSSTLMLPFVHRRRPPCPSPRKISVCL